MRDFKRNNNFGGKDRSFGKNRGFGNRGGRPTLYKTQCSKCGRECEVPFRPTGEKPVFCRECFREMGGNERKRPESFPSDNQYKQELATVNEKLDAILRILNAAVAPQEPVVEKKKKAAKKSL